MSKTFAFQDGDWVIQPNGQPLMVDGLSKVGLDIVHALSHPYDAESDYGFEFLSQTQRAFSSGNIAGILRRDVSATVSRLQRMQTRLGSALTDTEKITGIGQLVVEEAQGGVVYALSVQVGRLRREEISKVFQVSTRNRL